MSKSKILILLTLFAMGLTGCTTSNNDSSNQATATPTQKQQLVIETLVEGTGVGAKNGDTVTVNYVGTLVDGTKFDSSYDRGETFSFILGQGYVIEGWDMGLLGMKVGEKRLLTIPSNLGYGSSGTGSIPGGATLIFEVEMVSIDITY